MKTVVIASTEPSAGKTSFILGLAATLASPPAYLKPLGDRLIYRKKRLWDYDSALLTQVLGLEEDPVDMSLGFDPSKMRAALGKDGAAGKLREIVQRTTIGRRALLIEAGRHLDAGASLGLSPLQMAKTLDAKLILVGPDSDNTLDHLAAFQQAGHCCEGLVFTRVKDMDDFKETTATEATSLGFTVLGAIPWIDSMVRRSLSNISEVLLAKTIAAAPALSESVNDLVVGAASSEKVFRSRLASSKDALVMTSGDRSALILAALESGVKGVVLTNQILPSAMLVSLAEQKGIPLLSTAFDTFQAAKCVDDLEPLVAAKHTATITALKEAVAKLNLKPLGLD